MADVLIWHPETQGEVAVPDEALWHYRQAGWITAAEREENRRLAEEQSRPVRASQSSSGKKAAAGSAAE